ncbi:MAG: DUF4190 domain-containing protein [Mycobacterium sp.]|uniref:DUF4190 domain-containing protein n=1 Tax=Mycobacterium sp. TaxID=1785 RepID=UPI003C6B52F3
MTEQPPAQRAHINRMALASLLCSSLGLLCIMGPIAGLIFGFLALNQIKQTGQRGRGLAIAGIVIGALLVAIIIASGILNGGHKHSPNKGSGAPAVVIIVEPQSVSPFQPI